MVNKRTKPGKIFIAFMLAAVMLSVSSCSNPGDGRGGDRPFARIDVDHIEAVDSLMAEEALEECRIVKLEIGPNALIGKIHKILFAQDRLFVLDRSIAKNVFVFDTAGRHLYNMGRAGRGPGEYLKPQDIAIDSAKNELVVYDEGSKKLLVYDLSGSFKREHGINLLLKSIEYIDEDTILGLSHDVLNTGNDGREYPYDLLVFDRDGTISKNYLSNNTRKGVGFSVITVNRYFSRNEDNIFLSYLFVDTIYSLEKDYRPVPRYVLDFGSERIEKKDFEDQDKLFEQVISGKKRGIWRALAVTNDNMLIAFSEGIDAKSPEDTPKVLVQFPDRYLRFNGLSFKDLKWSFPVAVKDGYFVSAIPPQNIGKKLAKELGMGEQDNPILLFHKFKPLD